MEQEKRFGLKNIIISGIIGAVVAMLVCLLANIDYLAYAWIFGFISGAIIRIVIFVLKIYKQVKEDQAKGILPKPKTKEERALEKRKQEELELARYTKLVQSLSKKQIEQLEKALKEIEYFAQSEELPLPRQAQILLANIANWKDKAQEGTFTKKQITEFDQLMANFDREYYNLLRFSTIAGENALNKNLGFGVIGDVVDVLAYSALEALEKKKALNESQRVVFSKLSGLIQAFCKEAFRIANIFYI